MLFLGSRKMDPNCIDIGPYSPSASYPGCRHLPDLPAPGPGRSGESSAGEQYLFTGLTGDSYNLHKTMNLALGKF